MKYKIKTTFFHPVLRSLLRKGEEVELTDKQAQGIPFHLMAPAGDSGGIEKKGGSEADLPEIFQELYDGMPSKSQVKSTTNDDLRRVADALGVEIPEDAVKKDMVEAVEAKIKR